MILVKRRKRNTDEPKIMRNKIGSFAAVFTDITIIGALSEGAFIYIAKMTAIKKSIKGNPQKRRQRMNNIYTLSKLYAVHRIT